jgi:hypothetical protein
VSFVDPELCGGKYASVLDVLNSVSLPDDDATRFLCVSSSVPGDARGTVADLPSVI